MQEGACDLTKDADPTPYLEQNCMADYAVAEETLLALMPACVADDQNAERAWVDQQSCVVVKMLLVALVLFEIAEATR